MIRNTMTRANFEIISGVKEKEIKIIDVHSLLHDELPCIFRGLVF